MNVERKGNAERIGRLRATPAMRRLARENRLSTDDLILPMFVLSGTNRKESIQALPGIFKMSPDLAVGYAAQAWESGIPAVLLFGLPNSKDALGTGAYSSSGPVQRACRLIAESVPDILIITDLCLCQYTDSGHCGVPDESGGMDIEATLPLLEAIALSHADAGANMVAPSGMIDGQVKAIREALDRDGKSSIAIMGYSAKYASAYYGPFRDAVHSSPSKGDRRSHQMPISQTDEAMREMRADIAEGADWLMVKPALAYLDIVQRGSALFNHPIAAYNVSGEYAAVKAAAANNWLDERSVVLENLISIKRAGASAVITYHALDVSVWLREGWDFK